MSRRQWAPTTNGGTARRRRFKVAQWFEPGVAPIRLAKASCPKRAATLRYTLVPAGVAVPRNPLFSRVCGEDAGQRSLLKHPLKVATRVRIPFGLPAKVLIRGYTRRAAGQVLESCQQACQHSWRMKGHKRCRSGAWRLVVAAGTDPVTGTRRSICETVSAPNNRAGAELADARLAELVVAVESGHDAPSQGGRRGPLINELAQWWQQSNRPRRDPRSGDWMGWSPKTAKTVRDNFRFHILPAVGRRHAADVTAVELDRLYERLLEKGLSPTVVLRCHGLLRAMFNWAVRKKLVSTNPAVAADPPRVKPRALAVPTMGQVRAVQDEAMPAFAAFLQLAATLGARRWHRPGGTPRRTRRHAGGVLP